MSRIACLWVPRLPLVSHLRVEPELVGTLLAMVDRRGARSVVVASSELAEQSGVIVGMGMAQAQSTCAGLVIREVRREEIVAAVSALIEVAQTISSRVELQGDDLVFVDCRETTALWPSESALATALVTRALRCGVHVQVGIADSKLSAMIAAREGGGVCVVPIGGTRRFLAPRALALLDPDPVTAFTLETWGIRSIGELLALPAGAVAHRLGAAGAELVRRARGENDVPIAVRPIPHTFEESLKLEYAVDRVEPLLFVLRRLLERITARLEFHALGCREVRIALGSDSAECDVRCIPVSVPTADRRTLLTLVSVHIESHPPSFAVTAVTATGISTRLQPTQLDLFRPADPMSAALAVALARLSTLCGPGRVGVLRDAGTHRPDAVQIDPFTGQVPLITGVDSSPESHASRVEFSGSSAVVRLALRVFRPPMPIEVVASRNRPYRVRSVDRLGGRVMHWAGPWRMRGEWWSTDPYAREYYDVELSDGGVYRIYRDVYSGRWLADGVYD